MNPRRAVRVAHLAGARAALAPALAPAIAGALALALAGCARPPAAAPEPDSAYLFSYFTWNGDDGLHLAWSTDGLTWQPLNGGRALLTPTVGGAGRDWQQWDTRDSLMRDPSIARGPDGTFHLVWTIAWNDRAIGVAHSRDLIHWSPQERVEVMAHEPTALNAWAPDLFWDAATRRFVIVWASAIPGRFPATDAGAQRTSRGRADHRLYYTTTADFRTYAPTRLLHDGGFTAIDGTITRVGDRYALVMKDETFEPEARNLRVAFAPAATGPYGPAAPAFTGVHTEGPSILALDGWWYVYFDFYTRGRYGARRTRDFASWEVVSDSLRAPRGIRHGSAFLAPAGILAGLRALDAQPAR